MNSEKNALMTNTKPTLAELVAEAMNDSTFAFKFNYWTETRGKQVEAEWLMRLLVDALGEERIREILK